MKMIRISLHRRLTPGLRVVAASAVIMLTAPAAGASTSNPEFAAPWLLFDTMTANTPGKESRIYLSSLPSKGAPKEATATSPAFTSDAELAQKDSYDPQFADYVGDVTFRKELKPGTYPVVVKDPERGHDIFGEDDGRGCGVQECRLDRPHRGGTW